MPNVVENESEVGGDGGCGGGAGGAPVESSSCDSLETSGGGLGGCKTVGCKIGGGEGEGAEPVETDNEHPLIL